MPTYASLRSSAVTFLVQQEELAQEAQKMGVGVSQQDIDKQIGQIKKMYFHGSAAKFAAALKKQGITLSQYEQYELRPKLLGQNVEDKVTSSVKISDATAQKYYTQNKASFTTPKTREVRHILVDSKSLAETLEQKLKNGASFAALAKHYSKDTGSAAHGGKLCVAHGGTSGACQQTVAPFDKAAFSLKTNEISQPVKSVYGWHIIQALSDVKPAKVQDLQAGQGADPGEPRRAAEADGLAGLAREAGEGLQGQGRVPDGLHAGDDHGGRDHDRVSDAHRRRRERFAGRRRLCRRRFQRPRGAGGGSPRAARADGAPAPRVPLGPRADGGDHRPAHDRGVVRGRGRRARRRRREAARRARRPALPGPTSFALLLEERGAGDLDAGGPGRAGEARRAATRTSSVTSRLETAERVRSNWERIKREQEGREGIFHDVAEALPGTALRAQGPAARAQAVGFEYPDLAGALADLMDELRELEEEPCGDELGDVLFAAVNVARKLEVDPELELRRAAQRFRARVEVADSLAEEAGENWSELPLERQDAYFDQAKERE